MRSRPPKPQLDGQYKEVGQAVRSRMPRRHMPASNSVGRLARQADTAASSPGAGAAPALPQAATEGQREGTEGSAIAGAGVDPLAAIARSRRRRSTASKSAGLGEQWGIVCGVGKLMLGIGMCGVELGVAEIRR